MSNKMDTDEDVFKNLHEIEGEIKQILDKSKRYLEKNSEYSSTIRIYNKTFYKNNNNYLYITEYNQGAFIELINEYSRSLAYAPINSEDYALALNSRSTVLARLFKYEECIIDVNNALKVTKDHKTKFTLLCRKVHCLTKLNNEDETKETYIEALGVLQLLNDEDVDKHLKELCRVLKLKPAKITVNKNNQVIETENYFISNKITWNFNEKHGNHIIANENIDPGEKIIIDKFYCGYPNEKEFYVTCSYCLNLAFNSIPCEHCVNAVFCSEKCKIEAWFKYHEIECQAYKKYFAYYYYFFRFELKNPKFLLAFRIFIKTVNEIGVENVIQKADEIDKLSAQNKTSFSDTKMKNSHKDFGFIYGLNKKAEHTDPEFLKCNDDFGKMILFSLKDTKIIPNNLSLDNFNKLKKIVWKLLDMINTNTLGKQDYRYFNMVGGGKVQFGEVVLSTGSLLNHNCVPNAALIYEKDSKYIIYAEKPIKKDEQVFISYLPGIRYCNLEQKKELLTKIGVPKCDCIACTDDWKIINLPENEETLKKNHNEIYNFYKSINETKDSLAQLRRNFNIKNINKISEIIKIGYLTLSNYDATLAVQKYKAYLEMQFVNIYGPKEAIPVWIDYEYEYYHYS